MASGYPGALDSFPTGHQDNIGEPVDANDINNLADAINKIEAELGISPSDVFATILDRLNAVELPVLNNQNVVAYTLALSDRSKIVSMINAAASTLTVPANATAAFPIGTVIMVRQGVGAGAVTIAAAAGVTVSSRGGLVTTNGAVAYVTLIKIGTNTWDLFGDLV